jgi:PAT family beta-lactamase induction signal transducer AmpG
MKLIGLFSLVTLPYSLKMIWAPLLDRFALPFLHRRAGWMFSFQVLLVLFICLLGLADPRKNLRDTAVLALIVAFLSASQDIAIDAYRAELLPAPELGLGSTATMLGLRLALLISGALALILSDHLPWSSVYALMAAFIGVGILASLFSPAPENVVQVPHTLREAIINPFVAYWKRPAALRTLLFILLFKAGDVLAGKMTTPFLVVTGFSNSQIGMANKALGLGATILGALIGGVVITRAGILRSLWLFGLFQPVSNLALVALALAGKNFPLMATAIGIENLGSGMGATAFTAFLMSITDKGLTATQFALFTSLFAITRMGLGALAGFLADRLSWPVFFLTSVIAAIPGLVLLWSIRREAALPPVTSPE